jgi:hypothetical protein
MKIWTIIKIFFRLWQIYGDDLIMIHDKIVDSIKEQKNKK